MSNTYTLCYLAEWLSAEYVGEPDLEIRGLSSLSGAKVGDISFLSNPRYRDQLQSTKASVVIISPQDRAHCRQAAMLIVEDPYYAYARVSHLFAPQSEKKVGIHPTAIVGEDCEIHEEASIGPYVVLGDRISIGSGVSIGAHSVLGDDVFVAEGSTIHPHVTLYPKVKLGPGVVIHSGAVLGCDGFGFAKHDGGWFKIAQMGGVELGREVEVGANTTIDCGALGDTQIGHGVKLDNQIQLGHNVKIGDHSALAGCVGIAGSTELGQHCLVGGGVGIAGHLSIADNVILTAMSGVAKSIPESGVYSSGLAAMPDKKWKRVYARLAQLEEIVRRLRQVERFLEDPLEEEEF